MTAGQDLTARVWDAGALGAPTAVLRGHDDPLQSAEFSPDGRFVLTTSQDGTARPLGPGARDDDRDVRQERRGRGAASAPTASLVAVGGPDTVQVHRCELCAPFDELVRIARSAPAGRLTLAAHFFFLAFFFLKTAFAAVLLPIVDAAPLALRAVLPLA